MPEANGDFTGIIFVLSATCFPSDRTLKVLKRIQKLVESLMPEKHFVSITPCPQVDSELDV